MSTFRDISFGNGQLYKIWNFTTLGKSLEDNPTEIDYKTGLDRRLHPEYTLVKGELTTVKYFSEYGNEDSLVICVDIVWDRDEYGSLKKRTETRKYVIESQDGEGIEYGDFIKVSEKFYDNITASKADSRRRDNIVSDLTSRGATFGVLTQVQELWRRLDNELNAYISTGDPSLIGLIGTYDGQWIDSPIPGTPFSLRQFIMNELTI